MHYSREATAKKGAWAAIGVYGAREIRVGPGGEKYGSCCGRGGRGGDGDDDSSSRDSASMAEDMEVAAAAGGEGGHSQDDVSSRADRKRKAPCGPIKFTG